MRVNGITYGCMRMLIVDFSEEPLRLLALTPWLDALHSEDNRIRRILMSLGAYDSRIDAAAGVSQESS
jgi:hypothetical protein